MFTEDLVHSIPAGKCQYFILWKEQYTVGSILVESHMIHSRVVEKSLKTGWDLALFGIEQFI